MPVDPIIHCLQELTDYDAFERLCSAIMNGLGYNDIEPIGGKSDKGRDALFTCTNNEKTTVFSYSVRQDWKTKLNEDCFKVGKKHKHPCDEFVYVTTASLSSAQRDKAIESVREDYNFDLKVYGLERLRVQLVGNLRHLIPQHPQIFSPPYFEFKGGVSTAFGRDIILLDHNEVDDAFALWLARRLTIQGYSVWCYGIAPMAGETVDQTVRALIENRAARYIPILSSTSLMDADLVSRISLAHSALNGLVLPAKVEEYESSVLPSNIRPIEPANFTSSWSAGLRSVLDQLRVMQIPKKLNPERAQEIALESYIPEPLAKPEVDTIWTNSFPVTKLPETITVYRRESKVKNSELNQVTDAWAYARLNRSTFAAFEPPPSSLRLTSNQQISTTESREIYGKRTENIVKEIVGRCLRIKGLNIGLHWCKDRKILYFPIESSDPQRSIPYLTASGKMSTVGVTGFRQWGSGERATKFHYQLAPIFRVLVSPEWDVTVVPRIYVRVTDNQGKLYEGKAIIRRRKKVTKSWWNNHFLARTLGVMYFFGQGNTEISYGIDDYELCVATRPLTWECPLSIDEEAVDRVGDFQEELASLSIRNTWNEDDESELED